MFGQIIRQGDGRCSVPALPMTTGRTELHPATIRFVRDYLARYKAEHSLSNQAVGDHIGASKMHVGQILNGEANAGFRIAAAVARKLNLSVEQLEQEARKAWVAEFGDEGGPALERPERYPNRAAVLAMLRDDLDAEVVRRVESRMLSSPSDMPRIWWVRAIINEIQNVELEREQPGAAAAKIAESEHLSDEANRRIEARRNKPKSKPRSDEER